MIDHLKQQIDRQNAFVAPLSLWYKQTNIRVAAVALPTQSGFVHPSWEFCVAVSNQSRLAIQPEYLTLDRSRDHL